MAGAVIEATFSTEEARAALGAMLARVENLAPFWKAVGEHMVTSTGDNFDAQKSPSGTPWAPLSPVTIARREKRGQLPLVILRASGQLRGSIAAAPQPDGVEIGTNVLWAGPMQFGAAQGAFGRSARGSPIPWGRIPARPFLGISADDEAEIFSLARIYLTSE